MPKNLDEVLERLPEIKDLLAKHPDWQEIILYPGIQYFGIKEDMGLCITALEEAQEQLITFRRENRHLTEGISTRDERIAELEKNCEMSSLSVFVYSLDRGEHAQVPGKTADLAAMEIIGKLEADLVSQHDAWEEIDDKVQELKNI